MSSATKEYWRRRREAHAMRRAEPPKDWAELQVELEKDYEAMMAILRDHPSMQRKMDIGELDDLLTDLSSLEVEGRLALPGLQMNAAVQTAISPGLVASQIEKPPGYRIGRILRLFLSKKRFDRVFGQTIADAHVEFFEALASNDQAEAKKIKRQLNFDLIKVVIEQIAGFPAHLISKPFERYFKGEE